ncbi:MAG: TetR/AcrR family transcriptional regulator [Pseudomonadota bacterium]
MKGRERIIDAAYRLFADKGYDAVGVREIAVHAGLSNPALYQHFAGKQALGVEVYRRCYVMLMEAIDERLVPGMPALDCLDAYIEAAATLHRWRPSPLLFLEDQQRLFGVILKKEFGDKAVSARLTDWIEGGRVEGTIRTDIPTPLLVASTIGQITKWAAMSSLDLAPKSGAAQHLKALIRSTLSPQTP